MDKSRITRLFCYFGHGLTHLFMLIYPTAVLTMTDIFDQSYAVMLAYATPGFIAYGAGSIPAGWLADKWSATKMLALFFIGAGAASIFTGMATELWHIPIGLGVMGAFVSIYHPVGMSILVANAKTLGKNLGINGMSGSLGSATAPLATGTLILLADWRMAFIVPGIFSVLMGIAFLMLVSETQAKTHTKEHTSAEPLTRSDLIRVFGFLVVAVICIGTAYNATSVALPKLFAEQGGALTQNIFGVGLMLSIIYAVAGFAQLIVGHLIDTFRLRPIFITIFILQAPLLYFLTVFDGITLLAVATFAVFLNIGGVPLGDAVIARYSSKKWRSTLYGVKFVLALGVSAVGVPLVSYLHAKTGGFDALFSLLAGMALATAIVGLILPKRKKDMPSPAKTKIV